MTRSISASPASAGLWFILSCLVASAPAQDWPQWRGSNRDGVVAAVAAAETWPDQLIKKWQIPVGLGHASPLLIGGKVYLFTRQGEEEVVSCVDLGTGRQLWRDAYPAPYAMNPAAVRHGKGPKSTPVFHEGKLCTLGIGGIVSCYDAQSGKLRWRADRHAEYPATSPLYGTAASPTVDGNLLITHLGGNNKGALTAFNLADGRVVWSWTGDGPGYASSIVVELGGVRQVVTQSQENLVGVAVVDGKLLWSIPFTTPYVQNIVTPVIYGQAVIYSGLEQTVRAIKVERIDGKWKTERLWENADVSFYMSTPVLSAGTLFGMSHRNKGRFVAMDAATGKTLWATTGREGDNAAILSSGDRLFFLTSDAELTVAQVSRRGFQPLHKYTVAQSPTWAHPVIAGKNILVKDTETLTLWSLD